MWQSVTEFLPSATRYASLPRLSFIEDARVQRAASEGHIAAVPTIVSNEGLGGTDSVPHYLS
jgi:hypothetical protein